jgi:hypothetical protein
MVCDFFCGFIARKAKQIDLEHIVMCLRIFQIIKNKVLFFAESLFGKFEFWFYYFISFYT